MVQQPTKQSQQKASQKPTAGLFVPLRGWLRLAALCGLSCLTTVRRPIDEKWGVSTWWRIIRWDVLCVIVFFRDWKTKKWNHSGWTERIRRRKMKDNTTSNQEKEERGRSKEGQIEYNVCRRQTTSRKSQQLNNSAYALDIQKRAWRFWSIRVSEEKEEEDALLVHHQHRRIVDRRRANGTEQQW